MLRNRSGKCSSWRRLAFRRQVSPTPSAAVCGVSIQIWQRTTCVRFEDRLAQARLSVTLLGGMFSVFAAIALVLASLGLYAVIAHSVSQRTQEIGVRLAMGAARRDILRLIYVEGAQPLALGLVIGLPAAFAVTHVLRQALIGISPGDPLTFLSVVLVLVLAGALGCGLPARRATKVDPIVALRYE